MARGSSNQNVRGSTADRKARKAWLLKTWAADAGQGLCRCYRCGCLLNVEGVTVDRIIPGAQGGTYRRNNIRPACMDCNRDRHNLGES